MGCNGVFITRTRFRDELLCCLHFFSLPIILSFVKYVPLFVGSHLGFEGMTGSDCTSSWSLLIVLFSKFILNLRLFLISRFSPIIYFAMVCFNGACVFDGYLDLTHRHGFYFSSSPVTNKRIA